MRPVFCLKPLVGMRLAVGWLVLMLVLFSGPEVVDQAEARARGPQSVADLADQLLDSVVNISTTQKVRTPSGIPFPDAPEGSPFQEFFDGLLNRKDDPKTKKHKSVQSLGSGFVIDASGIIITNNHVIKGADEIIANFNDGRKLKAEVIGRDRQTDIAVLRVRPKGKLKAVSFGNSDRLRVGDWVMAIGNPFGLGGSVTLGIVSARNRNIEAGPYDDFIQTDAAINRGNSGGPLFDMNGKVVGINTAIISPSGGSIGIGFSIPAIAAKRIIDQLITFGETRRGWLGVRIQDVTEDRAAKLGLDEPQGALVAGVTRDGPAALAGIKAGDVILSFDRKPVDKMQTLPRLVALSPIGKTVPVIVLRKGKRLTLKVTLGRLKESGKLATGVSKPEAPLTLDVLNMRLSPMTPALRKRFNIGNDTNGVVVLSVKPGSSAAEKGIVAGTVIVEVAQEEVATPLELRARIKGLKDEGRKSALLLIVTRTGELRFVAVIMD